MTVIKNTVSDILIKKSLLTQHFKICYKTNTVDANCVMRDRALSHCQITTNDQETKPTLIHVRKSMLN